MDRIDHQRDRPTCVCFVVENLMSAGTERWIVHLIERLDRRRVRPLLCLTDGQGENSRQWEPGNCEVLRLGLPRLKTFRTLSAARSLFSFLRRHQVDVVQVHHADPCYLSIPVARAAGVPAVVQTKYDVGFWLTGFDLWMHRRLQPWIDVTLANCLACRDAAIQQERAAVHKVVVMDNGIDTRRLARIPALTTDMWRSPLRVGTLAYLRPVKDPDNLVDAAQQLIDRSLPMTFHLAGEGPLQESLQADLARRGLADRVFLHGYVADTARFLETLQVFVLCSRSEGMAHALIEAMAAGRAVVATAVGGNRELIQDGVNGLLIPPADPGALAAAIMRLASDPDLAVRLGNAARHTVADRFDLKAMAERFADFYQSVLCQSARRRMGHRAPTHGVLRFLSAHGELTR